MFGPFSVGYIMYTGYYHGIDSIVHPMVEPILKGFSELCTQYT